MRLKKGIILFITCLLLFAIGVGVESVYCAYFSSGSAFRMLEVTAVGGVYVIGPEEENGLDAGPLIAWAKKNRAALLVIGDSPGIAVYDGSGGIAKLLKKAGAEIKEPLDERMAGVFVTNDAAYGTAYLRDGVFWPEKLELPVLGTYDEAAMPQDLRRPFYYPLSVMGKKGMFYLTDAQDVDTLKKLLSSIHPDAEITERSAPDALQFLSLLFHDPVESRARTTECVTILALGLCALFSGMMYVREQRRAFAVRRLFGMSFAKIRLSILGTFGGISAAAVLLFFGSTCLAGFSPLTLPERLLLSGVLLLVCGMLTAAITVIGMALIRRTVRGGMRYENDRSSLS